LFLIIFEKPLESEQAQIGKATSIDVGENACESETKVDVHILKLKQELQAKEESLKASNEELATSKKNLSLPTKSCSQSMKSSIH
jgi:two-component system CheB/CheR fusion protein